MRRISTNGERKAPGQVLSTVSGTAQGQEFEVLVRRLSTRRTRPAPPPEQLQATGSGSAAPPSRGRGEPAPAPAPVTVTPEEVSLWRYVVGSFVVRIPVGTGEAMLIPEAMTLAVMKWRLANISPDSRWAPVLERYINYCAARLDGIGGLMALPSCPSTVSCGVPRPRHRLVLATGREPSIRPRAPASNS